MAVKLSKRPFSGQSSPTTRPGEIGEPRVRSWVGRLLRALWRNIEPLWVGGLALCCLLVGNAALTGARLHLQERSAQWALYVIIGAVFPALLVALAMLPRLWRPAALIATMAKPTLALLCVLLCLVILTGEPRKYIVAIAAIQLVLMRNLFPGRIRSARMALIGTSFLVSVMAWLASVRLLWWTSFDQNLLFAANYAPVVFLLVLLLVCAYFEIPSAATGERLPWLSRSNLAALLVIGLVSVSTDGLFNGLGDAIGAVHHWGVYVGPAELVRQGGWLLWDVPSQYGLLSILALAIFPAQTPWQAMYVLNAAFIFVAAVILFAILRSLRGGAVGWCFALLTSLTTVFFLASFAPSLHGPQMFPSVGPIRFIWCYVLLAFLLWEYRSEEASRAQQAILLLGNLIWLVAVLWSAESAFYCSSIWLPAYAIIVLRKTRSAYARRGSWRPAAAIALTWISLPVLLLTLTLGLVTLWYIRGLGHGPDWRTYVDYVLAFSGGTFGGLINHSGAVWALLLMAIIVAAGMTRLLHGSITARAISLIAGGWGALWSVSSYFMGRADPSNILRITPIICVVIGLLLHLLGRRYRSSSWNVLFRVGCVPVLTVLLTMPLVNEPALTRFARAPQSGLQYKGQVERLLPDIDPSLLALFASAGVRPSDPLIYAGSSTGSLLTAWPVKDANGESRTYVTKSWLPTPFTLLAPLPPSRQAVYISRFVSRAQLSGWFVQRKDQGHVAIYPKYGPTAPFFDQLLRTHIPTRVVENENWQLIWFEYRGGESAQSPDVVAAVREILYEGLPADIRIDGQPEQPSPTAIWATHGRGWYADNPKEGRWAQSPAQLFIYSPDAREVRMRAMPFYALSDPVTILSQRGVLQVAVGAAPPQRLPIQVGVPFEASLELHAGWNTVTLTLEGGNIQPSAIDPTSKDSRLLSFGLDQIDLLTK